MFRFGIEDFGFRRLALASLSVVVDCFKLRLSGLVVGISISNACEASLYMPVHGNEFHSKVSLVFAQSELPFRRCAVFWEARPTWDRDRALSNCRVLDLPYFNRASKKHISKNMDRDILTVAYVLFGSLIQDCYLDQDAKHKAKPPAQYIGSLLVVRGVLDDIAKAAP